MREKIEFTEESLKIAKIAKALSHPARVHIVKKALRDEFMLLQRRSGGRAADRKIHAVTAFKELKYAGLIQGEINPPYIKYCINRENWAIARNLLSNLFGEEEEKVSPGEKFKKVKIKI
jgi:ArsR family transcriptional regulator, arsenate/arsenite/antimonite-responsive transcriptional repressor